MSTRTKIDDPDLGDLLDGIDNGSIGLPNFQRDFDWSDSDVKQLLATVLNGWPMGSLLLIDGDAETYKFYDPRPFEYGPRLQIDPETLVLDGQQRLTALYTALFERGKDVFAIRTHPDVNWKDIDSVDSAIESFRRDTWLEKYPNAAAQAEKGLLPLSVLRSPSDFFAWRDASNMEPDEALRVSELYREKLGGLHRYRVPALRISRDMHPAAVARIFERVNKTGRRLGTFDLMVAKSFSTDFNLRDRWREAQKEYPRLDRFYGEDGTVPLQVIALRTRESVRSSAVLELAPTVVQTNWDDAIKALDDALAFGETHLGMIHADWVPYEGITVLLAALRWNQDLDANIGEVKDWFWRTVFTSRYATASNTRIIADYKEMLDDGITNTTVRNTEVLASDLLECTKRSNGALHRAWICALTANYVHEFGLAFIERIEVVSLLERGGPLFGQNRHLLSLGFGLAVDAEIIEPRTFMEFSNNRGKVPVSSQEAYLREMVTFSLKFISSQVSGRTLILDTEVG